MKRSLLAARVRERLERLPPPYDNHYGVVPAPPPEESIDLRSIARRHAAAIGAIAKVDTLAAQTIGASYLLSRISTRREAVSSSAIEGTNSTLDELLAVEETADDGSQNAARQVRAYALSLEGVLLEVVKAKHSAFSLDLILRLHAEVMKDDPDNRNEPGCLRTGVVWIGGRGDIANSTWNPPPPQLVTPCLLATVDYLRNEGMQQMTQDLVTRMAIAHAHFEVIHPFRDGNGRVGRMLLPLMMAADERAPLYLSPYIEANKSAYYEALKDAQQRLRWETFIGFLSDAIVGTVDEAMTTWKALEHLRDRWLRRRRFRKGSAALRALDLLAHFPVITTARLAEELSVSIQQATNAVAQLEAAGVLRERTGYARNRVFAAEEALAIVNRPFGEEPPEAR